MCPFCMAAIGQIVVAGVVSTGGLTALAVNLSRKKNSAKKIPNPNSDSTGTLPGASGNWSSQASE